MPTDEDIEISELETFEPTRVDGVGKAANGFPVLMLKSLKPQVGETMEEFKERAAKEAGVAASGQPVPPPHNCPTCNGTGVLGTSVDEGRACPDCDGTGRDGQYNTAEVREGFGGSMSVGDPQHREKVDKSMDPEFCDDTECDVCKSYLSDGDDELLEKKRLKYKERKELPDSAFALPGRRYPIHDESHARNALARVAQHGTPEEQETVRAAVHRRYPDIEISKTLSDDDELQKRDVESNAEGTPGDEKAEGSASEAEKTEKADSTFSAPNPDLARLSTKVESAEPTQAPGSSEWEGVDAQTATDAAVALMAAAELIRKFGERESIEVAAGEGNDIFDAAASDAALCGVSQALGIMAQMAFHEGLAAQKSVDDVEKAGKRLSTNSVAALASARDNLTNLLGDDDPMQTKNDDDDDAEKAVAVDIDQLAKELEGMTVSELNKVLSERDEKLVASITKALEKNGKAKKGKSKKDEVASVARAKSEHSSGTQEGMDAKEENHDLEDEAEQGDNKSASGTRDAEGGAKAALTPEEIEADEAAKKAKKDLKAAKKAKKEAAENAAIKRALEESKAEAEEAVKALEQRLQETTSRLETVEKTVAPSTMVRTRPQDAMNKSAERDALELKLSRYEGMAKAHDDVEVRREYNERAKALRVQIAAMKS